MSEQMKNSITFVLPALNEEKLLPATVNVALLAAEYLKLPFEIIIIDDGSQDKTYEVGQSLAREDSRIKVIKHLKNQGLGAAYKTGIDSAKMEYLMLLPADDAWPTSSVIDILNQISNSDIVIPFIKMAGDKSAMRKVLSHSYTNLINLLFNLNIPYYNGVCLHKVTLLKSIQINANDFSYQTEVLVKLLLKGASFVTVQANTNVRKEGVSKALKLKNIIKVITSVLKLYYQLRILNSENFKKT